MTSNSRPVPASTGFLPVVGLFLLVSSPFSAPALGTDAAAPTVPVSNGPLATSPPEPVAPLDPELFPLPESLEPNVDFWLAIFTEHPSSHVVLHDEEYLDVVYTVLDFSALETEEPSEANRRKRRETVVQRTMQHLRSQLLALAAGKAPDGEEQERIAQNLDRVPGDAAKYRAAADRLRTQTGLKDRFAKALARSGRYLPAMEEIFARHGVPKELTRVAFVESMFQEVARSKVGAGGIWQIMPATGRRYLRMGSEMDERFDPLRAADAAARIFKENYQILRSWPIAITAYNHGVGGMRRAVDSLGTRDPGIIAARYKSRSFGFASRNFYTEFVAAATAYANAERLFPEVEPEPPWQFETFAPDLYVSAVELAEKTETPLEALRELNPAFDSEVWTGDLFVPRGYELRVPAGQKERFATAYAAISAERKSLYQTGRQHRVRSGETLSTIARRYGTSVAALQRVNGLGRSNLIRVGQVLVIPGGGGGAKPPAPVLVAKAEPGVVASPGAEPAATGGGTRHTVRPGETLVQIARRYGTTVVAITQANKLAGHLIYPRQELVIP